MTKTTIKNTSHLTLHTSHLKKILFWANGFSHCTYLNPNDFGDTYPQKPFKKLLAIGAKKIVNFTKIAENNQQNNSFQQLQKHHENNQNWLFGYFSYDLKNELEKLESNNFDALNFADIYFYEPEYLLIFDENSNKNTDFELITTHNISKEGLLEEIEKYYQDCCQKPLSKPSNINIQARITQEKYLQTIQKLKEHIFKGDIYEVNFCMEFFAENVALNSLEAYFLLNELSPMPFSAYHKINDNYVICASPERFLKKIGNKIISQPIKGTAKRGNTPQEDEIIKQNLLNNPKERSENIMIVDLVRNDLARSAKTGTVCVDELLGLYTFKQLHQLISTVSAQVAGNEVNNNNFAKIIQNAFPMGSMTGAPKIKAMQIIENEEVIKRSLYSGALGYIMPNGDFDFNVMIRSILYNAQNQYLSFQVGSAITAEANPQQEYEECLLKSQAIRNVLAKL